jgi:hypothetical protein
MRMDLGGWYDILTVIKSRHISRYLRSYIYIFKAM